LILNIDKPSSITLCALSATAGWGIFCLAFIATPHEDFINITPQLREAFPDRRQFRHAEGNSVAHLKASAMGSSATVIIDGGRPLLGTWQSVYFCEFDGPRQRRFYVKVEGH